MENSMRQTSTVVKDNSKTNVDSSLGWDAMIRDARKRIEDLKSSIQVYEKKKAERCGPVRNPSATNQSSNTVFKTLPTAGAARDESRAALIHFFDSRTFFAS